ncbi:15-O-acetyltransferase Tri3 [Colletotrichum cereale]|nr:15-O-acetyltransferase Tri3 [Colletotrichum cereale]
MPTSPSAVLALPSTSLQAHDYRWRQANATDPPRSWIRTAFGAEACFGRLRCLFRFGDHGTNFVTTTLHIRSTDISLAHLEYRIARALIHLRFLHPEVACKALRRLVDDDPGCPPEVTYTVAKDAADVAAWASRTIHRAQPPRNGHPLVSAVDLRLSSVTIFSVLDTYNETAELQVGSEVQLIFAFHPMIWDSVSSRIFVGDLLRYTGKLWSAGTPELDTLRQYNWGTETDNLTRPILDACGADVSAIGPAFANTRDEYIRKIRQGASGWGLPVDNAQGEPKRIQQRIDKMDILGLKLAVVLQFGRDYTLTHLAHAAMLLALLRVSPRPTGLPSLAAVVSPILVNGRRYLKGEDNDWRYGSCLASAFVDFAPLEQ